jgi:asparagine N-glycosylation enzyme membrane subunit Stt3
MTRRHYGIRVPKPRPTYTGPAGAGAWSGSAFIGAIVVILIVLGIILYGVSKTVTDAANTATSAPLTTGQGAAAPPPSGMAR